MSVSSSYFSAEDSVRNLFLQDSGIVAQQGSTNVASPSGAGVTIATTQFINRNNPSAARRRARLPDPGPGRRVAVDGGAAADRAHLDGACQHHGHALRAGRAVGRAAPGQRSGTTQNDQRPGRERQHGDHSGARAGAHPLGGLGHRTRPRGRGQRRHGHRPGDPAPARDRPALDHGPVPGRRRGHAP
jgi:hypothetical protein